MKSLRLLTPLVFVLAGNVILAQETTGTLVGKVADKAGNPIAGAKIIIESPSLLRPHVAVTDAKGTYRASMLPTGSYTVTFTKTEFISAKAQLSLLAGQVGKYDAILKASAAVEATVEVVDSIPVQVDKTETSTQTNLTIETMERIRTSNWLSIRDMAPGVVTSDDGKGNIRTSVRGGTYAGSKTIVNGASITAGDFGGESMRGTITDLIESASVIQSPLNAKYGGTDGGIVSVVTTHGSNTFSGTIRRTYSRPFWSDTSGWKKPDDPLNPNPYDNGNPYPDRLGKRYNLTQAPDDSAGGNWEATIRGPIWKDHISFAWGTRYTPTTNVNQLAYRVGHDNPRWDDCYGTFWKDPISGTAYLDSWVPELDGKNWGKYNKADWNQFTLFYQINQDHTLEWNYTADNSSYNTANFQSQGFGGGEDNIQKIEDPKRMWTVGYKGLIANAGFLEVRYTDNQREHKITNWNANNPPIEVGMQTRHYSPNGDGTDLRDAVSFAQLWEGNYFGGYMGGPRVDRGEKKSDKTFNANLELIVEAKGSHKIDVGTEGNRFIWDTQSQNLMPPTYFVGPGRLSTNSSLISDPNVAGKFLVWNTDVKIGDLTEWRPENVMGITQDQLMLPAMANDDLLWGIRWLYPKMYRQYGKTDGQYHTDNLSLYVNDLWTINDHLSLMGGVRWDNFKVADDRGKLMGYSLTTPRFEAKWDLFGDQSRLLNFSWGRFASRIPGGVFRPFVQGRLGSEVDYYWTGNVDQNPYRNNPDPHISSHPYLVNRDQYTNPANYTYAFDAKGDAQILDKNIRGPLSEESTLGFKRVLDDGGWYRISGVYRVWKNLYDFFPDSNESWMSIPDAGPGVGAYVVKRILRTDDRIRRHYKAVEVEWNYILTSKLTFGGNYSYSRYSTNDYSGTVDNPSGKILGSGADNGVNWRDWFVFGTGVPNTGVGQVNYRSPNTLVPENVMYSDEVARASQNWKTWFSYDLSQGKLKSSLTLRANYDQGGPMSYTYFFAVPTPAYDNYNGSRRANNSFFMPTGGQNQFSYNDNWSIALRYNMEIPIWKSVKFFMNIDVTNPFNTRIPGNYVLPPYYQTSANWNSDPATAKTAGGAVVYGHGWRGAQDLSGGRSYGGLRYVALESGIKF